MGALAIIGLISGIASIISIPLAFYFNRKSQLNKYEVAKRKIIETLLFQIGSGQKLDLLGMKLIIDSKLREAGLRPGRISIQEIIADLYTNVTTNPLIGGFQKDNYQLQIKRLGLTHTVRNTMNNIREHKQLPSGEKIPEDQIEKLEKSGERYKIDYLKRNHLLQMQNKITYITKRKSQLELFVEFSTILSIIVTIPSLFFYNNFLSKTQNILNPVLLSVIISIATGILITLISSIVSRIRARRSSDTEDINEFVNVDDENSNGPLYKP